MGPRSSWFGAAIGVAFFSEAATPPSDMPVVVLEETAPAADVQEEVVETPHEQATRLAGEAEWPADHRRTFLDEAVPLAIRSGLETCVPPSVTIAQAVLESGWGRSNLAKRHHNWFGIKGRGPDLPTAEADGPTRAQFQSWPSPEEGVAMHARILTNDARYAAAKAAWPDGRATARALASTWATDPAYADRLVWLIDRYALDRWDQRVASTCAAGDGTAMVENDRAAPLRR